jgi:hypothetical protein
MAAGYKLTFECSLNVDRLLCAGLKVWDATFGLAKRKCSLLGYLTRVRLGYFIENTLTTRLLSSTSILLPITTCIKSVNAHDEGQRAYKWKVLRIHGTGLDEKLVSPAVKSLETLGIVHIVDEYAAVSAPVESHTQRLETFLACCIPKLRNRQ